MRGSPIRTSSDQRSVGSSPRLIAASYVLHRLLVPRHPPCALNNLTTQTPTPTHQARRPRDGSARISSYMLGKQILLDARVHCAVLKVRRVAPPPPPPDPGNTRAVRRARSPRETTVTRSLRTQQRAYGPAPHHHRVPHPPPTPRRDEQRAVLAATPGHRPNWSAFHPRAPPHTRRRHPELGTGHGLGAALDHPTPPGGATGGQCSLERR